MKTREYETHQEYLDHQASKLSKKAERSLSRRSCVDAFLSEFRPLMPALRKRMKGRTKALCLGARRGAEVLALRKLGIKEAIGIDVNPGSDDPSSYRVKSLRGLVEQGDFHDLPYEDSTFWLIYTNCLDHVFDIGRFAQECRRVIEDDGIFLLRIPVSNKGGRWESLFWRNWRVPILEMTNHGWSRVSWTSTSYPKLLRTWVNVLLEPV